MKPRLESELPFETNTHVERPTELVWGFRMGFNSRLLVLDYDPEGEGRWWVYVDSGGATLKLFRHGKGWPTPPIGPAFRARLLKGNRKNPPKVPRDKWAVF